MSTRCINSIEFKTNNNEIISVSSSNLDYFYVGNLDQNGDETNYELKNNNDLFANFFMVKIINDNSDNIKSIYNRLINKKDIVGFNLGFTNGEFQKFDVPKKRIATNGIMENKYEETFILDNDLGIIITDKEVKYKKELFI